MVCSWIASRTSTVPHGFGFIKDRWHVAGFESHGFSAVPGPAGQWEVRNIELVSLLLHDQPEVYLSDRLPGDEENTRHAEHAPLDQFERFGLVRLERGEDLFISAVGGRTADARRIRSPEAVRGLPPPEHGGPAGGVLVQPEAW